MRLKRSSWYEPTSLGRGLTSHHEVELKLPGRFRDLERGDALRALIELPDFRSLDGVKTLSPVLEFLNSFPKSVKKRPQAPMQSAKHWLSSEIDHVLASINNSKADHYRSVTYGDFSQARPWVWQFTPTSSHWSTRTVKAMVEGAVEGSEHYLSGVKIVGYWDGLGGIRAYYGVVHSVSDDSRSFVLKTASGYRRFLFSRVHWYTALRNVAGTGFAVALELVGTGEGKAVMRLAKLQGQLPKTPPVLSEILAQHFKNP